jgi:hypothetical protein
MEKIFSGNSDGINQKEGKDNSLVALIVHPKSELCSKSNSGSKSERK